LAGEAKRLWARALFREAAVFVFFLALAVLFTWPLSADLAGHTLPGPDPMHDLWSLYWTTGHLLDPVHFFHGNIYYPARYSTLYMDLMLGSILLAAPLRLFVHDPVPLYNLTVLLTLAFSGWGFHRLLRALTGNSGAGLLSGVLATFASHQMWHVYHMNMIGIGWLPLFWLGLLRLLERPRWPNVLLTGVGFALAAQSSGYYAAAGIIVAPVFAALRWRRLRDHRVWAGAAGAVAIAALLMVPYLRGYRHVREVSGMGRTLGNSEQLAFHPEADLRSRTYVYRRLVGTGGEQLFPGLLPLVLAGLALWRRRPYATVFLAAGAALLLFSLGPTLQLGSLSVPLPYRLLFSVPPFGSMRHPHTFAAVATFMFAVVAGLGFASLSRARRPRFSALFVALAVAETLGPGPKVRPVPPGLPDAYRIVQKLPPGPVLEVGDDQLVLVWAARSGLPMVNGGAPFGPPYHLTLQRQIRNHWLRRVPDDLDRSKPMGLLGRYLPVRYVIVDRGRRPLRYLAAAFDDSRRFSFVARAENGDRIYELGPEADSGAGGSESARSSAASETSKIR
jgi:hypothetical protein